VIAATCYRRCWSKGIDALPSPSKVTANTTSLAEGDVICRRGRAAWLLGALH